MFGPASRPRVHPFKSFLPRNGMAWEVHATVLGKSKRDRDVMRGLAALGIPAESREIQTELTRVIEAATHFVVGPVGAALRAGVDDEYDFLAQVRRNHRLGGQLAEVTFVELFHEMLRARSRFLDAWRERGLPDQNLVRHAPLARAIDQFHQGML